MRTTKEEMKHSLIFGIQNTTPKVISPENSWVHLVGLKFFDLEQFLSAHPGGVLTYDEPGLYDEKYGYWLGDDPFETSTKSHYPLLMVLFGFFLMAHFHFQYFRHHQRDPAENQWHQRLTAFNLEDRIREIRKEDAPYRYP